MPEFSVQDHKIKSQLTTVHSGKMRSFCLFLEGKDTSYSFIIYARVENELWQLYCKCIQT